MWTERPFELLKAGKLQAGIRQPLPGRALIHVWGEYPRCAHRLDNWQSLSATRDIADVEAVGAGGRCGTTHPDALADTTGCRVSLSVEEVVAASPRERRQRRELLSELTSKLRTTH